MSNEAVHFRKQALTQRANAAEATLANVRERCERAAASWETMAERAERAERRQSERRGEAEARAIAIRPAAD